MGIKEDFEKIRRQVEEEEKEKVKIALFGQPGAGKSSLINAIIGVDLAKTGQKTDMTTAAEIYEYQDLLFVDLPGYGTSNFPPNEWFTKFKPEDYDLFLCAFSGKFHEADTAFFNELRKSNRVCIFTRTKADEIWDSGLTTEQSKEVIVKDVHKQVNADVTVYFTSRKTMEGIPEIKEAIYASVGPAKRDRFIRSVQALTSKHLDMKRSACERMVTKYAGMAAANALNPIPGVDVSVDLGILLKLFSKIRDCYGLDESRLEALAPALLPMANKVLKQATQEGVLLLLKRFATQGTIKEFGKYIPLVGQVIAASLGFSLTKKAGNCYLDDCHELAEKILSDNLEKKV